MNNLRRLQRAAEKLVRQLDRAKEDFQRKSDRIAELEEAVRVRDEPRELWHMGRIHKRCPHCMGMWLPGKEESHHEQCPTVTHPLEVEK